MRAGRRALLRWLGAGPLAALGCKIELILDPGPSPDPRELLFPDPRPEIPDEVVEPEESMVTALDEVLAAEAEGLAGVLRERGPESTATIEHLIARLQAYGLEPGGPQGGWSQPVELRRVELPADAKPQVRLRRTRPAGAGSAEAIELGEHGVFRQRRAGPVEGLPLAQVRKAGEALPREAVAGRVVLLRAPADLDVGSAAGSERIEAWASQARESGAAGVVVLTGRSDEELAPLRERWRQVLSAGEAGRDAGLIFEGVLSAAGVERLGLALAGARAWALEAELGLVEAAWTSRNVVARLPGQDLPWEEVVLVCAWDTPAGGDAPLETMRLLVSLVALAQVVEQQRRGGRLRRSIVGVFAVDAGLGAGQLAHARGSAGEGVTTSAVLAVDRVEPDVVRAAVSLSGQVDSRVIALAERACLREGRTLQVAGSLSLPWLSPYVQARLPVMTIGAGPSSGELPQTPRAGLHAEVRLVRELLLALAEDAGPSP